MSRTVTLTLSEQSYRYLTHYICQDAEAWAIFLAGAVGPDNALRAAQDYEETHSPIGYIAPPKPEPEPEKPGELLDGWYSPEHVRFYNQVIRQANRILREAARNE